MRPEGGANEPVLSRRGDGWLWHDGTFDAQVLWQAMAADNGVAIEHAGRGSAWRLELEGRALVCRHYRRGGWMGRVNRDRYVWRGARLSRPYREMTVMWHAANRGLRVPKPVAALAVRVGGGFYRAAILTPWIEHVGSLAQVSSERSWANAGRAIAQMHAAGIWHADLNVHNILIDHHEQAWLIDFDRAREGVNKADAFQANLSRLKRSVDKVCPHLGQSLWSVLCNGYAQG